jgi:hypothetical protein
MNGKIGQCGCIKFCMKLVKSATETLEMLREAFGDHSSSRTVVSEWHSCFKSSRVSAEDDKHSEQPSTSKATEDVEKIKNSTTTTVAKQYMSSQHWDQLWSLPGDLNRKCEHVPHCSFITTMLLPTHPRKPQSF